MEIKDCNLYTMNLKIENFLYLNFGHMKNTNLEMNMYIEYSKIRRKLFGFIFFIRKEL